MSSALGSLTARGLVPGPGLRGHRPADILARPGRGWGRHALSAVTKKTNSKSMGKSSR